MMLKYVLLRLVYAILMLMALASALFFLVKLAPGDPVQILAGGEAVTEEFRRQIEQRFGLDQPFLVQYATFMRELLTFDMGESFSQGEPIIGLVLQRLGNSFILVIPAFIISSIVGVLLGQVIARRNRMKLFPDLADAGALVLYSTPVFFAAQLLVLAFSLSIALFPVSGMMTVRGDGGGPMDILWHAVLPIIALSLTEIGFNARMTASSMVEVQNLEYITTGRAKGLAERAINRKYVLRNALMPIVTVLGYNFGAMLAGAVLVEIVFAWPGLGRLIYDSISARDNVLLIACIMAVGVVVVLANLITDIVYTRVDPRVRTRG